MRRNTVISSASARVEALVDELATLSAGLATGTQRQLALIRDLEPTAIWATHGAVSYAAWLGWRIGLSPGAAQEKIRVARALGRLTRIDAAFAEGRLSFSKVRALTRVAHEGNEETLVGMALSTTAAQLEVICRGLRRVARDEKGEVVPSPPPERSVRVRERDDGTVEICARLLPDEAARVVRAIELARGLGGSEAPLEAADGLLHVADAFLAGAQGGQSGAERAQLLVHVREVPGSAELSAERSGAPLREVGACCDHGAPLSLEALLRVACDASFVAVEEDEHGTPLRVGRKTRVIGASLRRALVSRDGGCQFPGCTHRAWLDGHHIEHWVNGGETNLANLVLVCPAHHRLLHESGFEVRREEHGALAFVDPEGRPIPQVPASAAPEDVWTCLSAGRTLDPDTILTRWDGRRVDYRACVEAAMEKLRAWPPLERRSRVNMRGSLWTGSRCERVRVEGWVSRSHHLHDDRRSGAVSGRTFVVRSACACKASSSVRRRAPRRDHPRPHGDVPLERIMDSDGFEVRVEDSGIYTTAGRSVRFVRDAERRITQLIDDQGRSVGYDYDTAGNLVELTDLVDRDTTYEYEVARYPHHLSVIVDHRGVRIAALDYQLRLHPDKTRLFPSRKPPRYGGANKGPVTCDGRRDLRGRAR